MATVSITIDDGVFQREMKQITKKLAAFQQALRLIGDEVDAAIEEAFQQKKSIDGTTWKPWAEATKKAHGTFGSLLNRTGSLKRSIRVTVSSNEVIIEARHPGAGVHQFGFPGNKAWGRGSAPIPQRKYMPIRSLNIIEPKMIKRLEDVLAKYFDVEKSA